MAKKRKPSANFNKKPRWRRPRFSTPENLSFPDRKISETFIHFARPLLDAAPPGATEADLEVAVRLAFTVWNAVVYADAVDNHEFLDGIREHTGHEPMSVALIEHLIRRKRELFGDDHRLVGAHKFYRQGGELRFRAEARDPRSSQ